MTHELLELDRIRLDDDLPYEELAGLVGIPKSVLVRTLKATTEPRDRTMHKIRRFIQAHRDTASKKAKKGGGK